MFEFKTYFNRPSKVINHQITIPLIDQDDTENMRIIAPYLSDTYNFYRVIIHYKTQPLTGLDISTVEPWSTYLQLVYLYILDGSYAREADSNHPMNFYINKCDNGNIRLAYKFNTPHTEGNEYYLPEDDFLKSLVIASRSYYEKMKLIRPDYYSNWINILSKNIYPIIFEKLDIS